MTNLLNRIKLYFIMRRYTKNAYTFGTMLSYSYMGEAVGYKKAEAANLKFALKLIKLNIRPWSYEEMAGVGWGQELPKLEEFKSLEEKKLWLLEQEVDALVTKEIQKIDLASKF